VRLIARSLLLFILLMNARARAALRPQKALQPLFYHSIKSRVGDFDGFSGVNGSKVY
jgi:hypothetical protein